MESSYTSIVLIRITQPKIEGARICTATFRQFFWQSTFMKISRNLRTCIE